MTKWLRTMLPLATLLISSGCVATNPINHDFPNIGLTIIQMSYEDIQEACSGATMLDNGDATTSETRYLGCTMRSKGIIYIYKDCTNQDLLLHELAHWDGSRNRADVKEDFPVDGC